MVKGTIKWFNNVKGIGFLLTDEHKEDVFVHFSKINMEGYKTVNAKQPVLVQVAKGDRGLYAEKVELL